MTWISTWPTHGRPTYAEHDTEQHALEIVRSGTAPHATAYQLDLPAEEKP